MPRYYYLPPYPTMRWLPNHSATQGPSSLLLLHLSSPDCRALLWWHLCLVFFASSQTTASITNPSSQESQQAMQCFPKGQIPRAFFKAHPHHFSVSSPLEKCKQEREQYVLTHWANNFWKNKGCFGIVRLACLFFYIGACFIYTELEGREDGSADNTPDTKAYSLVLSTRLP